MRRDRGLPTGVWNCTSSLGPAIAPPILTALMIGFGWRWMFGIMGVAGVVVAAAWFLLYRDPTEAHFTEEERHYLTDGEEPRTYGPVRLAEWLGLFRFRTTWGLVLGFFGVVYMGWLYLAWLPGYLEMQRHMSIPKTGMVAAIPFAFGVVGSIGGGWIADWRMRKGLSPVNTRKVPVIVGLLGMVVFTVVAAETPSDWLAVGAIAAALMFGASASGMSWALASVAAPANCTASLGAISEFWRLSGRGAGADGNRVYRAGDWQFRTGAIGQRGHRPGVGVDVPGGDPWRAYQHGGVGCGGGREYDQPDVIERWAGPNAASAARFRHGGARDDRLVR